jgi:hypothetical protein
MGRHLTTAALVGALVGVPNGAFAQTIHEVVISNESDYDVYELFVSPSEEMDWGPNQLGNDILTAGDGYVFDMEAGQWDFRFIDDEQNACVVSGLSVSEASEFTLTNDLLETCVGAGTDSVGGPGDGGFPVVFERAAGFEVMAEGLENDGVFQMLTAEVSDTLVLPDGLQTVFTACGMPNAFYDPSTLRITMCYEFFDLFAEAVSTLEMDSAQIREAIIGSGVFFYLHELGHALRHVLDLPVTGREEDAVDDLAAITLVGDDEAEGWLLGAMMSFAGLARSVEEGNIQLPFWDEHSLDAQRMYTVACVLYGSDPERHAGFVGENGLPEQRAARCPAEFEQKSSAWGRLLEPHLR